jgi:hypothetical protein
MHVADGGYTRAEVDELADSAAHEVTYHADKELTIGLGGRPSQGQGSQDPVTEFPIDGPVGVPAQEVVIHPGGNGS